MLGSAHRTARPKAGSGAKLPQTFPGPSPLIRTAAFARQTQPPLTWDRSPNTGGRVTSWIKYLGRHGVCRFSRFRSSTRCFSSRRRFCSVAASMSPSRRYLVTSCQRFLGMHGGQEVVRQGPGQVSAGGPGLRGWGPGGGHLGRSSVGVVHSRCLKDP